MGSEDDIARLAAVLMEKFAPLGLKPEQARAVATFIEGRLARENERFNARLLSRAIMRLSEAGNSKSVALSMAFAIRVPSVWVRGVAVETTHRSSITRAAEVLGVTPDSFRAAVRRSAEFLGLKSIGGKAVYRRAAFNKSWRTA